MTEEEFLRSFAKKENQISRTAIPSKRQVRTFVERRKGHRMTSERMRRIMQQTPNPVRAAYQSAAQAARGWTGVDICDESVATRNVGPSDLPRSSSGKQTIGPRTY
jgi:hypothetical protein